MTISYVKKSSYEQMGFCVAHNPVSRVALWEPLTLSSILKTGLFSLCWALTRPADALGASSVKSIPGCLLVKTLSSSSNTHTGRVPKLIPPKDLVQGKYALTLNGVPTS